MKHFGIGKPKFGLQKREDVPGLVTEASTIEILTSKLRKIIPELIQINKLMPPDYVGSITFELTTHRQELIEVTSR